MLRFLQDEMAGLRQRWLRVLVLLTCLGLMVVIAQQERAIETQRTLIQALAGDSNDLQRSLAREQAQAQSQSRDNIYITDSRIVEPKQAKPAPAPEPAQEQPPKPTRVQKLL